VKNRTKLVRLAMFGIPVLLGIPTGAYAAKLATPSAACEAWSYCHFGFGFCKDADEYVGGCETPGGPGGCWTPCS